MTRFGEFHTFALETEGNMGDTSAERPRIQVATDASLDEGAIIRTIGEPSPLSSGVEYFLGLEAEDVTTLLDALESLRDQRAFADLNQEYAEETISRVEQRVNRLLGHMNAPQPDGLENQKRTLVVRYDVTGLTEAETAQLRLEAEVQAERSKPTFEDEAGHPSVGVTSEIVEG